MERMRIASAERARKFEQAELDSRSHALAYEKGMEELRKRRAMEAERRKRGEEDRNKMDEERAVNRERKLKAMTGGGVGGGNGGGGGAGGGRNGGAEGFAGMMGADFDDGGRRGSPFRSANGGVRGARYERGERGERREGDVEPSREVFGYDEFRGGGRGGRGRGGGGRGSGGRGGGRGRGGHFDGERGTNYNNGNGNGNGANRSSKDSTAPQSIPTEADFPALPPKKFDDTPAGNNKAGDTDISFSLSPDSSLPPVGKWDDEMAELDAKRGES